MSNPTSRPTPCITVEDLTRLAEIALEVSQERTRETGKFVPRFVYVDADGHLNQLPFPEEGAVLMSDAPSKNMIIKYCRALTESLQIRAWIFVSSAWVASLTPDGCAMMESDKEAFDAVNANGTEALCQLGLATRRDMLVAHAQNKDWMVLAQREVATAGNDFWDGPVEVTARPQDSFDGRFKMFGVPKGATA